MATSSKIQFKLDTLREEALKSIDLRIEAKAAELASLGNDDTISEERKIWRARQEARISELFSKLGDDGISDVELALFTVEKMPEVDVWDTRQIERDLRSLRALRTQIVAKSNALVPDEAGNIALTKTQMSEFFGL